MARKFCVVSAALVVTFAMPAMALASPQFKQMAHVGFSAKKPNMRTSARLALVISQPGRAG